MYESTIIAISTEAGYLALHEHIQEGWEPLFVWEDTVGQLMVLRRENVLNSGIDAVPPNYNLGIQNCKER